MYEKLYGTTGVRAILGSGVMWAWFDALYMGAFFAGSSDSGLMAELATMLAFGFSLVPLSFALVRPALASEALSRRRCRLLAGGLGTAGSLLFVAAGLVCSWPLLVFSGALAGLAMGFMTVAWGAVYAQGGSITATPYVAGAFAFAIAVDLPSMFMFPLARGVFCSLLPLASCLVLDGIDADDRSYAAVLDEASSRTVAAPAPGRRRFLRGTLGVPVAIALGYGLVMLGFGYLQHLISFSSLVGDGTAYGTLVQGVRGIVSVGMFVLIFRDLRLSRPIYRVGLPLMIAGCMTLPFTFGGGLLPASGAVIIGGYTAFDLFAWVIFCSIACTQSRSPLRTVVAMRVICAVGHLAGSGLALGVVGFESIAAPFVSEVTVFVGYVIVIAVVLLLSSEEVFALSNGYFDYRTLVEALRTRHPGSGAQAEDAPDGEGEGDDRPDVNDLMDERFASFGLTRREGEVARLLAHGRTQRWIADYLCISENTVGTHLRRIYQKTGVHNRQQFLDALGR